MPRIRMSTARLETPALANYRLGSGFGTGTRAMMEAAEGRRRATDSAIRAVDATFVGAGRVVDLIDRRAERDASEAATVWETAMLNGLEGTAGPDGKPRGGIAQKTWRDYEGTDSSPITDLGEIEKSFCSSSEYRNLSGLARKKFDRRVMTRRAQYLGTANRIYDRHASERTRFLDAEADANAERKVETAMLADDATFEGVLREETFRKAVRKYRDLMENPEVADAPGATPASIRWKDRKYEIAFGDAVLGEMRKLSVGRCAKMAEAAAMEEPKWVDGRLVTNEEALVKAEAYAVKLSVPTRMPDGTELPARITPEESKALGYKCLQARSVLDDRARKAIAAESAAAIAEGDLKTLEAAEARLSAAADGFAECSAGRTAALVAKNTLAEKADKRAVYDLMNDLSEGRALETKEGVPIFDPKAQARYARLYPEVKAAWEQKVYRANRQANVLKARAKMLDYAASEPQAYYNYLADEVIAKRLSPNDFTTLKSAYDNGWMRGYKGARGQQPKQLKLAGDLLNVIKTELGADLAPALEANDDGTVKLDRNGMVKLAEKGEKPTFEYDVNRDWWFDSTERFTTSEMASIVNLSLSLAMCDGLEVDFDPTVEQDPDNPKPRRLDKPIRINALRDFKAFIARLKDSKRVQSAANEMRLRAIYANNVRLAAGMADRQRVEEMTRARPVRDDERVTTEEDQ